MRFFPLFAVWLLGILPSLAALEPGRVLWGFDGRFVANTFNLVSIELQNPGGAPFDGVVQFESSSLTGASRTISMPVYVAPNTRRWVQFTPYGTSSSFTLNWRDERGERAMAINPVQEIKTGPPAIVILAAMDAPGLRSVQLPVFDEALFPTTPSAADGLHAVVLDHSPRWDATRRQAFLDWVKLGGVVHIVKGPAGAWPEFGEELATLNGSEKLTRLGAGRIARHEETAQSINPVGLEKAGFPMPALRDNPNHEHSWNQFDATQIAFNGLSSITRPKIAWDMISFLTFVYIALIGPAFYFNRKRDYRVLLTAFVLVVAGFSWIFITVGRRGYGESQIIHSLGMARMVEDGRYDVQQWVHAFATEGDRYALSHGEGSGQLYALPGRDDTVRAMILAGPNAGITAEIPLFASQPYIHRGVLEGPKLGLRKATRKDTQIIIPHSAQGILVAGAQTADTFHPASMPANTIVVSTNVSQNLNSVLNSLEFQQYYYGSNATDLKRYAALPARLVSNDPNDSKILNTRTVPSDTVRLFLYLPTPASFANRNPQFKTGHSYTLFVCDLPVTPTP